MRSFNQISKLVLDFAISDHRVRAVLLNGSRVNRNVEPDSLQDYDLVFIVDMIETFTNDHSWTEVFGEKLIWQLPDEMIIGDEEKRNAFAYLMIFKDSNRIDLTLFPANEFNDTYSHDSLTEIWLDKDNLFEGLEPASDKDYWISRPTEKEFIDICNEFWWVSTYVVKGIKRNEIIYAKEMMDNPVRKMFNRMIELYVGINTNFSVSVGNCSKFVNRYLSKQEYDQVLQTYPNHEVEGIIYSLTMMMNIFSKYATTVATSMKFVYNKEEEINSRKYFEEVLLS